MAVDEDEIQRQIQQRVSRERERHKKQEGFDTDVHCLCNEEGEHGHEEECLRVPVFHIKQLDGDCYYSCRTCLVTIAEQMPDIPLEKFSRERRVN